MNINCETILDYYTYENKRILCQIKVTPSKGHKLNNTCRCLTHEQWKKFDKELKKLIAKTDHWNDGKCLSFSINPYIEVKVQKSKLTLKHFYKCLGALNNNTEDSTDDVNFMEANFVLECLFVFQLEIPFDLFNDSQEYVPQVKTSPDGKLSSPLSYEPYTPSTKKPRPDIDKVKNPGIDFLGYDEDTYSPKHIFETAHVEPTENIPKYTPAPIQATQSAKRKSYKSTYSDLVNEFIVETEDEIGAAEISKPLRYKLRKKSKKKEIEYTPTSQEHTAGDVPIYIPTPIEDRIQREVFKTELNIIKNKTRSKTIDERSALFNNHIQTEQFTTSKEHLDKKNVHNHEDNRRFKKRSITIDEISAEFSFESKTEVALREETNDINEKIAKTKENLKEAGKTFDKLLSSSSSDDEFLKALKKSQKPLKAQTQASDDEFEDQNKMAKSLKSLKAKDIGCNSNITIFSSVTNSATETTPQKLGKRERQPKESSSSVVKSLRRSERSPSKPVRFMEEPPKKPKNSHKNKELFGTDDDDDDDNIFENNNSANIAKNNKIKSVFETPISKKSDKSSSSSSSTRKKRRTDKASECEQEKRNMSKWLSKKKSSPTSADKDSKKPSKETTKSSSSRCLPSKITKKEKPQKTDVDNRPKSPSPTTFELPSKEELESIRNKTKLMQKTNAKVRAELDKLRTSPPKEVEFLSLQNVPVEDILKTFSAYKSELDKVYENNRKIDYIKGHDGINHCFVIRLLQQNIQMKMLEKLTEVYSNAKSTTQATLFANALLPEWVIRVYMEKFKFTRQQAIDQIKAQEEFQLHMEEQSDNSFMFD